jgi:ornithine carbamoyltransferase
MVQLGVDTPFTCRPMKSDLGKRESVADVARNLERWCQAIMARVYAHQTLMRAGGQRAGSCHQRH